MCDARKFPRDFEFMKIAHSLKIIACRAGVI